MPLNAYDALDSADAVVRCDVSASGHSNGLINAPQMEGASSSDAASPSPNQNLEWASEPKVKRLKSTAQGKLAKAPVAPISNSFDALKCDEIESDSNNAHFDGVRDAKSSATQSWVDCPFPSDPRNPMPSSSKEANQKAVGLGSINSLDARIGDTCSRTHDATSCTNRLKMKPNDYPSESP
ncbi:hypothetical protein Nepgr_027302 [Nepenthes gracilis]|uniref:Uncharacterized protein n=1 Tax=Nepenthes gracilis TaxID=150966 RepID=A0AAD3TAK4_NEPGR|nr:hypothetical protein Nepgr_027302 [Nepenthes gracilis]